MDRPIRSVIKTFSFKTPLIKINSIPVESRDEDETTIGESTPLALVPPASSSKASSVTFVEEHVHDAYANVDPTVHTHGWKPETMQSPVLLSLALASLLIAALLEILAQKSAADGALSIVATAEDIPPLVSFGYLYLPTIVAVLYSLAWNWVDLDVKRMQPWLQLSRDEGALGKDSLFLDYPVDFVAFVPFKAARNRHWAVFYSGTIVVLVFWLLTPMQGAVFGTAAINSRHAVNMTYPLALVNVSQQAALMDQSILNAGYAVTWLNQTLPAYTTLEYALQPFEPSPGSALAASAAATTNWTGTTTKYWTTLDCWPSIVDRVPGKLGTAHFLDGRGCNASELSVHSGSGVGTTPYKLTYIGYQDSAWADYSLQRPTCGRAAWNEFLATMAVWDNRTSSVNFTSAFCEAHYWRQPVRVTVATAAAAAGRRPVGDETATTVLRPLGAPQPLRDAEFNTSAFQYLLGAGVSSVARPRDFPFSDLLEHTPRVHDTSLESPLSPMVGFAIGGQSYSVEQYTDRAVLTSAVAAAHKMLFAMAYSRLLVNATSTTTTTPGEASVAQYGVVVSRLFSALVEGCLLLVAVMALLLLCACRRGASMLREDPASMDSLLRLVRGSDEMQTLFSGTGHMGEEELRLTLGEYSLKLRCGCGDELGNGPVLTVTGRPDYDEQVTRRELLDKGLGQAGYLAPMKPAVLRTWAGLLLVTVLAGVTGLLVYLKQADMKLGGLSRPSSNFELNLILTNYLPTAFSTLVEPLWVLLNRYYCMLQPFYDLVTSRSDRGKSTITTTQRAMQSRYSALPPQLVFMRAVRARHFLLAAVCITALLGNVLAVGLGALFNELPRTAVYPGTFARPREPVISRGLDDALRYSIGSPFNRDPYYVVMANMTYGTALPPWTTSEFGFLPLVPGATTSTVSSQGGLYTGETTGFGVEPGCAPLGVPPPPIYNAPPPGDDVLARTQIDLPADALARSSSHGCARSSVPAPTLGNDTLDGVPGGRVAVEVIGLPRNEFGNATCAETLVVTWARAHLRNRTSVVETSTLVCSPALRTARFRVSFDAAGYVHAATPLAAFASAWSYENASVTGEPILAALQGRLGARPDPWTWWHSDTVSRDWLNHLVMLRIGPGKGRDLLDPAAPLPSAADMVAPVSAVYKMIFAAVMGLSPEFYVQAPAGATDTGTQVVRETRVFVNTAAFAVSTVVLGIYMIMAAVYYSVAVKLFLPRMPSTVGSLLAYIAPSGMATREAAHGRHALHFGRYVGPTGHAQIGIDRMDKVVPLDMSQLGRGDTKPLRFRFLKFGRSSRTADTWL